MKLEFYRNSRQLYLSRGPAIDNIKQLAKISVRGVVQGVGFRPFVYQLADRYSLTGWVCNTSGDVKIEVEGDEDLLKQFVVALKNEAPPMAHIEDFSVEYDIAQGYNSFQIRDSITKESEYQLVSPDIATCKDCLNELLSPDDRRYRYPFTNCTNCGPRFTIIEDIPYDRPRTTMRSFTMCPQCQHEYDNPLDRRFHAQPNACPECGPHLELVTAEDEIVYTADPVYTAVDLLKDGQILAIKGLGGFQLACDATNQEAVQELRNRKRRPDKPFAVMISTIDEARKHCDISEEEEKLLTSPQCPIVLLRRKRESSVAAAVAPELKYLGVMLPYTPLHHLLMRGMALPLVMTSGNLSEEPIVRDNDEAMIRLKDIADYFLMHNRDIYARYDDSVCIVEKVPRIIRRARGYAPFPIHLPFKSKQILGCGAEMKNTFCITRDNHAFIGQHIGDMENLETIEHYESTIELYKELFRLQPEILACDMHPDYLATKYAFKLAQSEGLTLVSVQHHHAHIASCMVENGVREPVIGISFDGTGYGIDGCIWGGEFLIADLKGFERMGHLEYVPLPGGDAAAKKPYRMAASYLYSLLGESYLDRNLPFLSGIDAIEINTIKKQIDKKINSPLTSSCGRLFDAVSALVNLRGVISYDAQAAIELEMIAPDRIYPLEYYPLPIDMEDGTRIVRLGELFSGIVNDIERELPVVGISIKFHNSLANVIARMCEVMVKETGITKVALSGGVFQNRLLLKTTMDLLADAGFTVLTHSQVPCNDGGISLGQAAIANFAS